MKAVLFDFGGTIDTDGVHWSEKFWEYYQQFGVQVQKKDVERAFVESESLLLKTGDLPNATFYKTLHKQFSLQFTLLKLESEHTLIKQMVDECYKDIKSVIEKARQVLVQLESQYTLGVVSNFYGNLEIVCKEFQLDGLFKAMIDSVVVGVRKPDPKIFSLAFTKMNIPPKGSFVVGDSYERDIVPAKQLGCKTIWLKGKSWTSPASTEAADYTIMKFEEIRNILL